MKPLKGHYKTLTIFFYDGSASFIHLGSLVYYNTNYLSHHCNIRLLAVMSW